MEALSAPILVTYMKAQARPHICPPMPLNFTIELRTLDSANYLELYRKVGASVNWDSRLKLTVEQLDALLANPSNKIYVISEFETPVGFCELHWGLSGMVELTHFGVVPEAKGRGLGFAFLANVLQMEWMLNPKSIWLHTDEWDSPLAQNLYLRAGFEIYEQRHENPEPL